MSKDYQGKFGRRSNAGPICVGISMSCPPASQILSLSDKAVGLLNLHMIDTFCLLSGSCSLMAGRMEVR